MLRRVHADALAWGEAVLGAAITETEELSGGLTSTMLALTDATGQRTVLRLMTNEPWRTHGAELTSRERTAQEELAPTQVPAPTSIAVDAEGSVAGVAAHLMSRLPGTTTREVDASTVAAMVEMLALIHDVKPAEPFRTYQSWAWEAKWAIPPWTKHPESWQRAFDLLAEGPPSYAPTFLHRDYSHRNLLWRDGEISGVVDWVETSSGPVWLDAGHAATNLALAFGPEPAKAFIDGYAALMAEKPQRYWLVMDAVGFLPPPGKNPLFGSPTELQRLDRWVHDLIGTRGVH
ncbi:MAG TPA: aminoglycoside phosphotransferase family protein [Nocardioidaceae bacterium]|nr:aminoglycoside phosphotransferase family protein [Nocardioidaceae bacterium]